MEQAAKTLILVKRTKYCSLNKILQYLTVYSQTNPKKTFTFIIQCPPLNRITLGQHKSDTKNRMIQLNDLIKDLCTDQV